MTESVKLEPCPSGHAVSDIGFDDEFEAHVIRCMECNWRTWGHTEAEAIAAWNTRHQPQEREAVLEIRAAVFEAVKAHHTAPALLRRDMLDDTLTEATSRILAALKTTPAPAVSRDDQALFNDICDKMAEVVAPLPGIPDAPGDAGTRAIEPSDGAGK